MHCFFQHSSTVSIVLGIFLWEYILGVRTSIESSARTKQRRLFVRYDSYYKLYNDLFITMNAIEHSSRF